MKLQIGSKKYDFFNNFTVNLKFDSVGSTFRFDGVFDYTNEGHLELFRPCSYHTCKILSDKGDLLITGTILNNTFTEEAEPQLASISGYSKSGVLEDCKIPPKLYPLQFDGLTLKEITQKLITPFNIGLIVDGTASADANAVFEIEKGSESQSVKSFLSSIANQKNIILSHNSTGSLVLTKGKTQSRPIAKFSTSDGSATKITMNANGQNMHSQITVQKEPDIKDSEKGGTEIIAGNAGEETINNPFVSAFRPTTKTQSSGDDNDTSEAAKNALGSELKGIKLTIETDRLEWLVNGRLETIEPNRIISVIAPQCHIFKATNFFIESVTLTGVETSEKAVIKAVLPEVYNGNKPKNIFL